MKCVLWPQDSLMLELWVLRKALSCKAVALMCKTTMHMKISHEVLGWTLHTISHLCLPGMYLSPTSFRSSKGNIQETSSASFPPMQCSSWYWTFSHPELVMRVSTTKNWPCAEKRLQNGTTGKMVSEFGTIRSAKVGCTLTSKSNTPLFSIASAGSETTYQLIRGQHYIIILSCGKRKIKLMARFNNK